MIGHVTPHIGVDRHPQILHLHLPKCGGRHQHCGELEIIRNWRANKAAFQTNFANSIMIQNLRY